MNEGIESFVGGKVNSTKRFEDKEVSEGELIEAISEAGDYLTKSIVADGVRRVEIISVLRSYLRDFKDNRPPVPCVDLKVKVISDGRFKDEEFIFTIRRMNIKKMIEMFGSKYNAWIGKKIHLSIIKTPKGDSIVVDSD